MFYSCSHPLWLSSLALVLTVLSGPARSADTPSEHAAVKPVPRLENPIWSKRHESLVARAKKGGVGLLFLGDSLTQGWEGTGQEVWKKHFEPRKAANFGIGGDRTQHLLWRITAGKELEGIQPEVVVLLIGTNNLGSETAEQIAEGIAAIVNELKRQRPQTTVLLLGIFPRGSTPSDRFWDKIKDVNKRIGKLADGKQVRVLDIGARFLEADGSISKEIMPNFLHLSAKGYQRWAEAIQPALQEILKK
jgi:lysophospholipase L1-like esterase